MMGVMVMVMVEDWERRHMDVGKRNKY